MFNLLPCTDEKSTETVMRAFKPRTDIRFDEILLVTDFTAVFGVAAEYTKQLARKFGSTIQLVHVIEPSITTPSSEVGVGTDIGDLPTTANENMSRFVEELREEGVNVTVRVAGDPNVSASVLDIAHAEKSDIILIGMRARTGIDRLVLGSMTETIIRSTDRPVITFGPNVSPTGKNQPFIFHKILCAISCSPQSLRVLGFARGLARTVAAYLYMCQAPGSSGGHFTEEVQAPTGRKPPLAPWQETPFEWCDLDVIPQTDDAVQSILDVAHRFETDLIVMGTNTAGSLVSYLPPGIAYEVISRSHCPVLTLRG